MKRILLTGGRAPATLELARLLHAAGHTIFVAESVPWHLCRGSRAVSQTFWVPPPNQQPRQFIDALIKIVQGQQVDILIPTCEETLFVAAGRSRLTPYCIVFTDDIAMLELLHNKYSFVQQAQQFGLPVPHTQLVTAPEQVYPHLPDSNIVLKPIYSRFGTHTVILPRHTAGVPANISPTAPWVMQEFMPGRQLCTYSIAHSGQLAAHSAYAVEYTAGRSAIAFEPLSHPAAFEWVQHFVTQTCFTGQIAFDFIETAPGRVVAIECNPRTTSGINLFGDPQQIAQAFLGDPPETVTPSPIKKAMLTLPMLAYGLPKVRSWAALHHWANTFFGSRDVIFNWRDPLPGLFSQWASLVWFGRQSLKHRVSLPASTTLDIEWNSATTVDHPNAGAQ